MPGLSIRYDGQAIPVLPSYCVQTCDGMAAVIEVSEDGKPPHKTPFTDPLDIPTIVVLPEKPEPFKVRLSPTETVVVETDDKLIIPLEEDGLPVAGDVEFTETCAPDEDCCAEYVASFSPGGVLINENVERMSLTTAFMFASSLECAASKAAICAGSVV